MIVVTVWVVALDALLAHAQVVTDRLRNVIGDIVLIVAGVVTNVLIEPSCMKYR